MAVATKSQWEGRLGIEVIGKMLGCCVGTIIKWRPQYIGQRQTCGYCNSSMKTIRAGEMEGDQNFTGALNECRIERAAPNLVLGGLYFQATRFPDLSLVERWLEDRDVAGQVQAFDQHAHYVPIERLQPVTVRAIWVAPGVVGEVGIAEKDGMPAQGGQASMHSPGISTVGMMSGGTLHPSQGMPVRGIGDMPSVLHGTTEMQDGHRHEFHLSPYPDANGFRVKGFSSFNDGHAHMIEAALSTDGSLDARTAPDQAPVGGHAHAHRILWTPGAVMVSLKEQPVCARTVEESCAAVREKISAMFAQARTGEAVAPAALDKAKPKGLGRVQPSGEFVGGFEGCVAAMKKKSGIKDPEALCAFIGRKAGKIKALDAADGEEMADLGFEEKDVDAVLEWFEANGEAAFTKAKEMQPA